MRGRKSEKKQRRKRKKGKEREKKNKEREEEEETLSVLETLIVTMIGDRVSFQTNRSSDRNILFSCSQQVTD